MKENRKLLKEILKDIRHDMTDEEVLNLLADSKVSINPAGEKEKYTLGQMLLQSLPEAGHLFSPLQVYWFYGWCSTLCLQQKLLIPIHLFYLILSCHVWQPFRRLLL